MEQVVLLSQAGLMSVIAGWLILGVRDNILYPHQNQRLTDMVLCMEVMAEEYPQFYAELAHRRVTEPTTQKLMFRLMEPLFPIMHGIGKWPRVFRFTAKRLQDNIESIGFKTVHYWQPGNGPVLFIVGQKPE